MQKCSTNIRRSRFPQLLLTLGLSIGSVQFAHAATSVTRTSAFDYDVASGLLKKEVVEYSDTNLCLVTAYTLDAYGRQQATTTRNCNGSPGSYPGAATEAAAPGAPAAFTSRTSSNTYTADQRFIATTTNPLGHIETKGYDSRFGAVTSLTGPNNLTTQWAYDNFGRKVLERRADGNGTKWEYQYCSGTAGGTLSCPNIAGAAGAYAVTATPVAAPIDLNAKTTGAANGPYGRTYHDSLGREIRSETLGFDGATKVYQDTEYNSLGQVARKSRPYYASQAAYWISYDYDLIGRVTSENAPTDTAASGAITTTTYSGLTVTVTDPLNRTTTQVKNVAGQVASITDAKGNTLTNVYDPLGALVQTTDAKGNITSLVYDRRGRKTAQYDPDMGVWQYGYDALGQLVRQTDAKGQVSTMAYDVLGRMTSRSEPSLNSNWYYDKYADNSICSYGAGKLCEVTAGNGYKRKHVYDSLGRSSSTSSTVDSVFTASIGYDANGRVSSQTFPSGLRITNSYTTLGYLRQVIDARTGGALWTASAMDAEGRVTQQTYGNGVVTTTGYYPGTGRLNTTQAGPGNAVQFLGHSYDNAGKLTSRVDLFTGVNASYQYDEISRVTSETRSGAGLPSAQVIAWTYDAIGNISTRTEAGTTNVYNYNTSGAGSTRPHAVANVSGLVNGYAVPRYDYDANGNLNGGAGRGVSWFSFNKVQTVASGPVSLNYLYDADQERAKETYILNGALQRSTVYLNPAAGAGLYYEDESGVAGIKKKHFITAAGGTVAVIVCTAVPCTSTANTSTQYWHKDHLGSVSVVTNAAGAVVERLAYEPFGKRRNSNGVTDTNGTLTPTSTDRGYTGHEHMAEVGMINMNGRIYDPGLGRFVSADPIIQSASNLQSYNRYSYIWNNPLNGTDPSGYKAFWKQNWFRQVASLAVAYVTGYYIVGPELLASGASWAVSTTAAGTPVLSVAGTAVALGAGGFAGSFVGSGGDLRASVKGAITAAAFSFAGDFSGPAHYAAHGAVGCMSAEMNGGNCGKGAIAQMVSLGITDATASAFQGSRFAQFAATTVAGGTASRLMGGSFANGAQTAAYGYLFNSLAHPKNTYEASVRQAILRGDLQELRTVLGNGVLSADDALIAQRALTGMESLGAENSAMLASRYGVDWTNKVGHAFGKEMHNLGGLVEKFGSAERAFVQIQTRVDSLALPAGRFEQSLSVGGTNLTVRGFVQDGVAKISTVFKP